MIPGTRPALRSDRAAPLPARERVAALIRLTVAIVCPRSKPFNVKENSASASRGAGDAAEVSAYNGARYGKQGMPRCATRYRPENSRPALGGGAVDIGRRRGRRLLGRPSNGR